MSTDSVFSCLSVWDCDSVCENTIEKKHQCQFFTTRVKPSVFNLEHHLAATIYMSKHINTVSGGFKNTGNPELSIFYFINMSNRHKLQQYLAIFASQVTGNIFYVVIFFCFNFFNNLIAFFFSFRFVGFFKKVLFILLIKMYSCGFRAAWSQNKECTQLMLGGNKMVDWLNKTGLSHFLFELKKTFLGAKKSHDCSHEIEHFSSLLYIQILSISMWHNM